MPVNPLRQRQSPQPVKSTETHKDSPAYSRSAFCTGPALPSTLGVRMIIVLVSVVLIE